VLLQTEVQLGQGAHNARFSLLLFVHEHSSALLSSGVSALSTTGPPVVAGSTPPPLPQVPWMSALRWAAWWWWFSSKPVDRSRRTGLIQQQDITPLTLKWQVWCAALQWQLKEGGNSELRAPRKTPREALPGT
jgi:hypothetical protein